MTPRDAHTLISAARLRPAALAVLTVTTLALGGCRIGDEPGAHVAGWTLVDARQRHPIVVSEQPANMTLRVARGSQGLTPQQRANAVDFMTRYRGRDAGNARVLIAVPSGTPNEVAAMHAVADLRQLMRDFDISDANMAIRPYAAAGEREPPIRITYTRFVAEAPECGDWSTNLAEDPRNVYYPNFGCAQQRNLAAQIANPADLLGPRTMSPAASERRDVVWDKFTKGDSTITKKDNDERTQTKNVQ
jgi:pilus assembly protein CpaD